MTDKEIVDKIISIGIQKHDCLRLIKLVDLIIANERTPRISINTEIKNTAYGIKEDEVIKLKSFQGKAKIPLGVLSASGFEYEDVKKLQKISEITEMGSIFIQNDYIFNKDVPPPINSPYNTPRHPEEIKEVQENILLSTNKFIPEKAKEELLKIQEFLPNKIEKGGKAIVAIDLHGKVFLNSTPEKCFIVSDKKLEILRALSGKKPKTIFDIKKEVEYTEERRVSTAIKEINDVFKNTLLQETDLIENTGKGYRLSKSTYDIRILNR